MFRDNLVQMRKLRRLTQEDIAEKAYTGRYSGKSRRYKTGRGKVGSRRNGTGSG